MRSLEFGRGKHPEEMDYLESTTTIPMTFSIGLPDFLFGRTSRTEKTGEITEKNQDSWIFKVLIFNN